MKFIKIILLTVMTLLTLILWSSSTVQANQSTKTIYPTMGVLGDSISAGWTGTIYNSNQAYPDFLRQNLGVPADQLINYSVPHGRIVGNRFANCHLGNHAGQDMRNQILQHKTVISHLKTLYIAFGLNDYAAHSGSGSLNHIGHTLSRYLQYIQHLNPNIRLYGILPLVGFSSHNNPYDRVSNDRQFTLKQLRTKLSTVYAQSDAIAINPNLAHAITAKNRLTSLADQHVHPTVATNQIIAQYIAQIVKTIH
ncbi:SGNH/GDSL hydrolase family protein [uncultured Secundilactobacillus sp.]|uniref:SGNH/GDSL hydrolase family protein n=1 Tax=uncultured Secundilactobacillus sp. TaxID=2813935 RepID=UPI00258AF2A7|nr:SGNH/GDSL hydrolase family protein [uncultured Secundilactobacillus sp.]